MLRIEASLDTTFDLPPYTRVTKEASYVQVANSFEFLHCNALLCEAFEIPIYVF